MKKYRLTTQDAETLKMQSVAFEDEKAARRAARDAQHDGTIIMWILFEFAGKNYDPKSDTFYPVYDPIDRWPKQQG